MSYELFSPFQKQANKKIPMRNRKSWTKNKYLTGDEQVQ